VSSVDDSAGLSIQIGPFWAPLSADLEALATEQNERRLFAHRSWSGNSRRIPIRRTASRQSALHAGAISPQYLLSLGL
jgi:hypothetical protein